MRRNFFALGLSAVLGGLVCGCGTPPAPLGPPAASVSVIFLQPDGSTPWGKMYDNQMKASVQKHPEVKFTEMDAGGDVKKQLSQLDQAIAQKPKILMVSPVADSVIPQLANARKAGIYVFLLDRYMKDNPANAYVGNNNQVIGEDMSFIYGRNMQGKGPVLVLPGSGSSTCQSWVAPERAKGIQDGLGRFKIATVMAPDCGGSEIKARDFVAKYLAAKPAPAAIFAVDDDMGLGAAEAVASAHATNVKCVFGIGADQKKVFDALRSGELFATFSDPPAGPAAMDDIPDWTKGSYPPKAANLTSNEVRKDTIGNYLRDNPILAD